MRNVLTFVTIGMSIPLGDCDTMVTIEKIIVTCGRNQWSYGY